MKNESDRLAFGLLGAPAYLSMILLFAKIFGLADISIWIVLLPTLVSSGIIVLALVAAVIISIMRD